MGLGVQGASSELRVDLLSLSPCGGGRPGLVDSGGVSSWILGTVGELNWQRAGEGAELQSGGSHPRGGFRQQPPPHTAGAPPAGQAGVPSGPGRPWRRPACILLPEVTALARQPVSPPRASVFSSVKWGEGAKPCRCDGRRAVLGR